MINLVLTVNREILNFKIIGKIIYYTDRKWKKWIQCVPKDPNLIKAITLSRNRLPLTLVKLFDLTEREQAEYEATKTEEELAQLVIKDAGLKGVKLLKKEVVENESG
tara:strand:+ start:303 stop:623 length:321 start_codon:yes stop_codon:yes gene_type:complete